MTELYTRIVTNEIKMKDTGVDGLMSGKAKQAQSSGWMDNIMNLIPGRKQQANNEPSEENIKKTHEYLRWGQALKRESRGGLEASAKASPRFPPMDGGLPRVAATFPDCI